MAKLSCCTNNGNSFKDFLKTYKLSSFSLKICNYFASIFQLRSSWNFVFDSKNISLKSEVQLLRKKLQGWRSPRGLAGDFDGSVPGKLAWNKSFVGKFCVWAASSFCKLCHRNRICEVETKLLINAVGVGQRDKESSSNWSLAQREKNTQSRTFP